MAKIQVVLNKEQRTALSWLLDPNNQDGEPFSEPQHFELITDDSDNPTTLSVNGAFLHTDGEWATYDQPLENPGVPEGAVQPTRGGMLRDEERNAETVQQDRENAHRDLGRRPVRDNPQA